MPKQQSGVNKQLIFKATYGYLHFGITFFSTLFVCVFVIKKVNYGGNIELHKKGNFDHFLQVFVVSEVVG